MGAGDAWHAGTLNPTPSNTVGAGDAQHAGTPNPTPSNAGRKTDQCEHADLGFTTVVFIVPEECVQSTDWTLRLTGMRTDRAGSLPLGAAAAQDTHRDQDHKKAVFQKLVASPHQAPGRAPRDRASFKCL